MLKFKIIENLYLHLDLETEEIMLREYDNEIVSIGNIDQFLINVQETVKELKEILIKIKIENRLLKRQTIQNELVRLEEELKELEIE